MNESAFNRGQNDAYTGKSPLFVKVGDVIKQKGNGAKKVSWDRAAIESYIDGYETAE